MVQAPQTNVVINSKHISLWLNDPTGELPPANISVILSFSASSHQSEESLDLLVNQFAISIREKIHHAFNREEHNNTHDVPALISDAYV
jgi:hypothetical protein